jgi:hypothetical protein
MCSYLALKSVRVHLLAHYMSRGMCEQCMFQTRKYSVTMA